jgi:UDP-2,3-diacylglucosamine pyrophosphatase LpxH
VICGDLFELWQSNVSKVLTKRLWLLDRLAEMGAIYVLGNHRPDLLHFVGKDWLVHPFFGTMRESLTLNINGKLFHFIHGHQPTPIARATRRASAESRPFTPGWLKTRNGSPMLNKYRTVEDKVVGRLEKLVSLWGRLRGKPDRFTEINRALSVFLRQGADVVVCGHTHFPGHIGQWHFNCGTWAEKTNSYVVINENGTAGVFDWANGKATRTRLSYRSDEPRTAPQYSAYPLPVAASTTMRTSTAGRVHAAIRQGLGGQHCGERASVSGRGPALDRNSPATTTA